MPHGLKAAFDDTVLTLPLSSILPRRPLDSQATRSPLFRQIKSSIEEVGVIEPLVVYPQDGKRFVLLDGHLRLEAMKILGRVEARVLISTDDEGYTYNKRVNHIPPVAQHFMLLEALKRGVPEKRIAAALNMDIQSIRTKVRLLDGICREVVEILKDRHVCAALFPVLRKMKPAIQIATAELMVLRNDFSAAFARSRLALTPPDLLVDGGGSKRKNGNPDAAELLLEDDTEYLVRTLKSIEASYGTDILTLTVGCGYIDRWLAQPKIVRYLERFHAGVLATLRALLDEVRRPGRSLEMHQA